MAHTTTIIGSNWLATAWQRLSDLGNPFAALVHTSRRHRQVVELSNLDDHLLEDIGLTRADVIAFTGPDEDPLNARLCNLR